MRPILVLLAAIAALGLGGCASVDPGVVNGNPAALHGDYSGKDFSGAVVMIHYDCDIPGVPASSCKKTYTPWTDMDERQLLHMDARCQQGLFILLPKWAKNIAKESGLGALATAVGEGGFAAAFPGADLTRYFLAGFGYGLPTWANDARIRQDKSVKHVLGSCGADQVRHAQKTYHILKGWGAYGYDGPGRVSLPPVEPTPARKPHPRHHYYHRHYYHRHHHAKRLYHQQLHHRRVPKKARASGGLTLNITVNPGECDCTPKK